MTTVAVNKGVSTDCKIYDGYIQPNGYPKRGHTYVHREALEQKLGRPLRAGMDACHTCDVRACVNPEHLYEGTRAQNMRDCSDRDRHNKPVGEKHWGAVLSDAQVVEIRELSSSGLSFAEIGRRFGVHASTASRIGRSLARVGGGAA